jgi:hypothetical protein
VRCRYLVGGERDDVDGFAGGGPHGAAAEHPLELLRAVPQQLGRQAQVCETQEGQSRSTAPVLRRVLQ